MMKNSINTFPGKNPIMGCAPVTILEDLMNGGVGCIESDRPANPNWELPSGFVNNSKKIEGPMTDPDTGPEIHLVPQQEMDANLVGIKPQFNLEGINPAAIVAETEKMIELGSDSSRSGSNLFPIEVFPDAIQQIIHATEEALNFPADFLGASMLFATSVAVGNTHRAEVKSGWKEGAVIYLAIVAPSGFNKSHPLSFALQPLVERDKWMYMQYEQLLREYKEASGMSKKERVEKGIEDPKKPVWQKLLLSDFTPEALAEIHKFNKRGIGVYVDELAAWFKNFNRYNKGSAEEFYLSTWSGKPICIDRKTGDPTFIPFPFISVAGTVQTGILTYLAKENRTQNGFLDRILFVVPDNLKKSYWSDTELDPEVSQKWADIMSYLLNIPITEDNTFNPVPEVLNFTPEAKKILYAWQKLNTDQCNDPETDDMCGQYSKLEVYAVRFALILELLRVACGESNKTSISIEATQGAIMLVEYFKMSAVKVHSIISNCSPLDNLPVDKIALYDALPKSFSTEEGLVISVKMGMADRTFRRFLTDITLFKKPSRGRYEKAL